MDGRYYGLGKILVNYDKNKKKLRLGIIAGSTHYDLHGKMIMLMTSLR